MGVHAVPVFMRRRSLPLMLAPILWQLPGCGGGGTADERELTLVSATPAAGSTGVAVDSAVMLTYSEELANAPEITLFGPGNKPIGGDVEVVGATVVFRPLAPMPYYTEHVVWVQGGRGVSGATPVMTPVVGTGVRWPFRTEPSATLPAIDFDRQAHLQFAGSRSESIEPQTIGVVNAGGGMLVGLRVADVDHMKAPRWVQQAILSGPQAPAQLEVKVDAAALQPGRYAVWVQVVGEGATNRAARVLVELEVRP